MSIPRRTGGPDARTNIELLEGDADVDPSVGVNSGVDSRSRRRVNDL